MLEQEQVYAEMRLPEIEDRMSQNLLMLTATLYKQKKKSTSKRSGALFDQYYHLFR